MPATIAAVCNVYNEVNALPGWLEMASQFFDDIFFFHTGPGRNEKGVGKYSTDGTIEMIEKWGARIEFGSIEDGFGTVRTELIKRSRCDWAFIMDADERFYRWVPSPKVEGTEKYPDVQHPKLTVTPDEQIDQGLLLRSLLERPEYDVIRSCRRHWFDMTWKRPCQNWYDIPDWQARVIRNNGVVGYRAEIAMHEQLIGCPDHKMWKWHESPKRGIFHDHFHCHFKPMEPEQRQEDIRTYDRIHAGSVAPGACHIVP